MQRRRPACLVVFGNAQCPDAQSAKLASLKRSGRPDAVHQSPRHRPSLAWGWGDNDSLPGMIGSFESFRAAAGRMDFGIERGHGFGETHRSRAIRHECFLRSGKDLSVLHSRLSGRGWVAQIGPSKRRRCIADTRDSNRNTRDGKRLRTHRPPKHTSNSQPDRHHARAGGREFKTAHARKTVRRFLAARLGHITPPPGPRAEQATRFPAHASRLH